MLVPSFSIPGTRLHNCGVNIDLGSVYSGFDGEKERSGQGFSVGGIRKLAFSVFSSPSRASGVLMMTLCAWGKAAPPSSHSPNERQVGEHVTS